MKRDQITFERHVLRNWDDSSKTHYFLAADPEHAHALARILKDCHDKLNDIEKDDDEWYKIPNREVTLPEYHKLTRGNVKCNLKETMLTLTSEVHFEEVLQNDFVKDNWEQIYLLASQEAPVDIWKESEFKELRIAVQFTNNSATAWFRQRRSQHRQMSKKIDEQTEQSAEQRLSFIKSSCADRKK
jgi:hypothetical protein